MRLLIACFLYLWPAVHSYNILCVLSVPSKSHNILGKGIVTSLLKAGHEVTWVSPYPTKEKIKGLTVIDISDVIPIIANADLNEANSPLQGLATVKNDARNISMTALNPILQKAIKEKQFDAVVTEIFFNEFDSGYAAVQGIPWIALLGSTLQPFIQSRVDAPNTLPILPIIFTNFETPMNFWERLATVGMYLGITTLSVFDEATNEATYKQMFKPIADARGVTLPNFSEAVNNISIMFVNSHPSFTDPISLPPNVIEVAGFHLDEKIPPLPEDLQKLMDSSSRGVVYFSMGSVVKSSAIPQQTRTELIKLFGKLPYTVLWKFDEDLDNLPPNVHIRKWMPQSSILAHPKILAFITHGGMLSQIEAISSGVPLISVPVFGDQIANARRAEILGFAKALTFDIDTLPQQLQQALTEILGNDKYRKRAKELSIQFNKRPIPPAKLISHYVELAIETKGAPHLRSISLQYSWYQRSMLDLLLILLIVLYVIYKLLRTVINFVLSKFKGNKSKLKRN